MLWTKEINQGNNPRGMREDKARSAQNLNPAFPEIRTDDRSMKQTIPTVR